MRTAICCWVYKSAEKIVYIGLGMQRPAVKECQCFKRAIQPLKSEKVPELGETCMQLSCDCSEQCHT